MSSLISNSSVHSRGFCKLIHLVANFESGELLLENDRKKLINPKLDWSRRRSGAIAVEVVTFSIET